MVNLNLCVPYGANDSFQTQAVKWERVYIYIDFERASTKMPDTGGLIL